MEKKELRAYMLSNALSFLPLSCISFLILLVVQGVALIPPLIMQRIIDVYIPSGEINVILWNVLLFISIPIISAVGQAFYQYYSAVKGRMYAFELNQRIFENIIAQSMTFHDKNNSGELAAQCTKDTMSFVVLWTRDIPETLSTLLISVIAYFLIFRLNFNLGISQLLYIPLVILPSKFVSKMVQNNSEKLFIVLSKVRALVQETFRGVKYLKSYGIENKIIKKYRAMYMSMNKLFGKTAAAETLMGGIATQVISSIFTGIGFVVGSILILNKQITIGALIGFMSLLPKLHSGIASVMFTNVQYFKQLGEYKHLFSYMMLPKNESGTLTPDSFMKDSLLLKNIEFSYDESEKNKRTYNIINNITMEFPSKCWIGIEGPSGVGKSTLLDILLLFYRPQSGSVYMDGLDCNNINHKWFRKNVALVQQKPFLFSGTLRENMYFVNEDVTDDEIWAALNEVSLDKIIRSSTEGLNMQIGEEGDNMSGGERQRLALALAFVSKRPLLIIDEATSNLDSDTEEKIINVLKRKVQKGLTIISISHRPAFHEKVDHLYRLDEEGVRKIK